MKIKVVPFAAVLGCFFVSCLTAPLRVHAQSNVPVRVMAANITSGNGSYQTAGINIFKGLKPDVVAIQEFKYGGSSPVEISNFVYTTFGSNFVYFRESGYSIPNGVISRWPIVDSDSWDDPEVNDRGVAWAQIDLPGTNDLYVVSVHMFNGGTAPERNNEAVAVRSNIFRFFPTNSWVIVAGDCNTDDRGEAAITTYKTFLSDNPVPTDLISGGDADTNEPRSRDYDYVLPSFSMTNLQVPVVIGANSFPNGLVFDSTVYGNNYTLGAIPFVDIGDSHVDGMQHMAVIKDFLIPIGAASTNPPSITTQPLSQTNAIGGNVTLSVVAAGATPLAYQWRFYGSNIFGATLANYALTNIQPTNGGDYTVVITNSVGSITSSVATLTVNAAPFINSQPQSLSVNLGANAAFNVVAAGGTPLFYQWRFAGTNIPGAIASSYTRTNAQAVDAGNYTVVVTNYAGSVTSAVAVLTVNVTPPGVIAQWNFNSIVPDGLTTTGVSTPSVGNGTASLVGGTTPTFATGDTTLDPAGSTDNSGWNTTAYPAQSTGNKTRGVQFSVSTVGMQNIQVTWGHRISSSASIYARLQYSSNGTDFIDYPTAISNSVDSVFERKTNSLAAILSVNNNPSFAVRVVSEFQSTAAGSGAGGYVVYSAGGYQPNSGTIRFDMVTISGAPIVSGTAPTITNQPASQTASQGDDVAFTVGADGTAPLNYQWRFNLANISGATSSSYTRSNVQPAHVGSYSVVVSNTAGFTTSSNATLTLNIPQPALTMPLAGVLQWQGLSNLNYSIQTSTNLAQTNWTTLGTVASPTASLFFTNAPATNSERYYRVVYP